MDKINYNVLTYLIWCNVILFILVILLFLSSQYYYNQFSFMNKTYFNSTIRNYTQGCYDCVVNFNNDLLLGIYNDKQILYLDEKLEANKLNINDFCDGGQIKN